MEALDYRFVCFFVIYSGKFLQIKCTGLPGSPDLLCTLHVLLHIKTIYTFKIDSKIHTYIHTYIQQVFDTPFPKGSGRLQKWKNNEHALQKSKIK